MTFKVSSMFNGGEQFKSPAVLWIILAETARDYLNWPHYTTHNLHVSIISQKLLEMQIFNRDFMLYGCSWEYAVFLDYKIYRSHVLFTTPIRRMTRAQSQHLSDPRDDAASAVASVDRQTVIKKSMSSFAGKLRPRFELLLVTWNQTKFSKS